MDKQATIKKMTPGRAIRAFCVNCCGGVSSMVQTCDADGVDHGFDACLFHRYRMGRGRPSVKVIRKFCLECMGGIPSFVRECDTVDCSCYPYRMGKNPMMAGKGQNAEWMAVIRSSKQEMGLKLAVQNQRSS